MRASLENRGFRLLVGLFNAILISALMVGMGVYIWKWCWVHT